MVSKSHSEISLKWAHIKADTPFFRGFFFNILSKNERIFWHHKADRRCPSHCWKVITRAWGFLAANAYPEPCQTSRTELFAKIVNGSQPPTYFLNMSLIWGIVLKKKHSGKLCLFNLYSVQVNPLFSWVFLEIRKLLSEIKFINKVYCFWTIHVEKLLLIFNGILVCFVFKYLLNFSRWCGDRNGTKYILHVSFKLIRIIIEPNLFIMC